MEQQSNIILEAAANECKKGDFKQGIHLYSKYIQSAPSDAKAYYQRGKVYFQIKDYNAAISDINKALALAPNDPHLIGERGLTYFMAKRETLAMDDFNKAIELDSSNPFRYASRAFIKDRLNDLDGAKEDYQKAIALDPDDAISYNNLGLVLDKMGRRKQANQHFEHAAEIDPKNFGMGTTSNSAPSEISDTVIPTKNAIDRAKKGEAKNHRSTAQFKKTFSALISSKEERKEFWDFIKQKFL
ncbi:MAG: tetratricopeptide (TPR) repeat protein [Marivirga sp.]|jgi:tetratricopeptide (TPR) repeat protein